LTEAQWAPVEHLASLRAIPGLVTLRPGDANVLLHK
jgi:transketolase